MLYVVSISIPPNTPKDKPIEKEIKIFEKWVEDITIYFPPGHVCLTGVALFYGTDQIFPNEEQEWVKGNDIPIKGYLHFRAPEKPLRLKVKAYNEDDTYTHTVYVYINTSDISLDEVNKSIVEMTNILRELLEEWRKVFSIPGEVV